MVISVATLLCLRPIATKLLKRNIVSSNVDEMIHKKGKMIKGCDELNHGEVKINGVIWTAISSDEHQDIKEGTLVILDGTVLDMMEVYDDLDHHIQENEYDVRSFGYDPYNAREFVERWTAENGPFGIEKVIQGAKTESLPLGELKILSEEGMLRFDEKLMSFAMGNAITLEDTNGNRKLWKKRYDAKIDNVAAMMDAYIAYKHNREAFE
jgi:phage terminase large subunit-like protein